MCLRETGARVPGTEILTHVACRVGASKQAHYEGMGHANLCIENESAMLTPTIDCD